jgi:thymidylate synthase
MRRLLNVIETADQQYNKHVLDILHNGAYALDRTGTGVLKRWDKNFLFRPLEQFPILTKKKVAFETAKKELFWIYQDQSNDVTLLQEKYGVKVWNEWSGEDGTIGRAYGYQVKKHQLIDRLIHTLKTNPNDRGMVMSLWSNEDLPEMNLRPCAFQTLWYYDPLTHELNMKLVQRSGDMGLGVPFNMTQYAILQIMIAHVCDMNVGWFKHEINDAHIYVNHINPLRKQLERRDYFMDKGKRRLISSGKISLHPNTPRDFYKIKPEHIQLNGYVSHPNIRMKVSV